jgi:hypothetical protein
MRYYVRFEQYNIEGEVGESQYDGRAEIAQKYPC